MYDQESPEKTIVSVPPLKGMTAEQAINSLKSKNLNINIEGSGKVISQSPINGTELEEGSIISVTLMDEIKDAY